MSEPFLGEIRMFPFRYAPRGWAFCDGQVMHIAQNSALFSLVGSTYGGDGDRTFALPDLRGRAPVHTGVDESGTRWTLGAIGGWQEVSLNRWELPAHTHEVAATEETARQLVPGHGHALGRADGGAAYVFPPRELTPMAREALAPAGEGQPHDNMQPYLTTNFCIALQGVFPQRPSSP
ncbi:MAG TPA: tail fiber protein [Actinomycetota bacterium]|nr:tail fiber protein [Actinomycetota bacterium]